MTVAYGQASGPETNTENLLPADARRALRGLIPEGKKFVTLNVYVAGTNVKDVDLGLSCSSDSSGTVTGTVDDNGNVEGKVNSNGSSDCRERHRYYETLMLGLPVPDDPKSAYFVTTQCVVKFRWDHCDMPAQHTTYPFVLDLPKDGPAIDLYRALGGQAQSAKHVQGGISTPAHIAESVAIARSPLLGAEFTHAWAAIESRRPRVQTETVLQCPSRSSVGGRRQGWLRWPMRGIQNDHSDRRSWCLLLFDSHSLKLRNEFDHPCTNAERRERLRID